MNCLFVFCRIGILSFCILSFCILSCLYSVFLYFVTVAFCRFVFCLCFDQVVKRRGICTDDFMSRRDKQVGLALIYSDQECWDVESPIIASITQAFNSDMGDRAVTFSRVEKASK